MSKTVWAALLRRKTTKAALCVGIVLAISAWSVVPSFGGRRSGRAAVVTGRFEDVVRARGTLQPLSTTSIKAKVPGTILNLAPDGARVEKGALLIEIDRVPYEEALAKQEALLARIRAEHEKEKQTRAKDLRQAQDDVEARAVRVELERLRLKTLEEGPTASDLLDASVALENAQALFKALRDELELMTSLAEEARFSPMMLKQKRLGLDEQESKVHDAEFALRKLKELDPVKVADQRQKALDEEHQLETARVRTATVEKNLKKAEEAFALRLKQEETRRDDTKGNITKTKVFAPAPGYALIGSRNGVKYGPGLSVGSREVLTFSDLRKMKAAILVDEGRVGLLRVGQDAAVFPAVDERSRVPGKVVRVAEHGHDEFEDLRDETRDIVGRADRQVFSVDVEIEGESKLLRPGQRVDVEIVVRSLDAALLVPRAAVFSDATGERFVWRERAVGIERAVVKVLAENDLVCAVEGLSEGEWVRLTAP